MNIPMVTDTIYIPLLGNICARFQTKCRRQDLLFQEILPSIGIALANRTTSSAGEDKKALAARIERSELTNSNLGI